MSHFIFKAKKTDGSIYQGEKDVADRYELYKLLHEGGDEIIEFTEKKTKGIKKDLELPAFLKRVKQIEKITFARNLGSMLKAGLSLSRSLDVLGKQAKNKALKEVIDALMSDIDKGTTFSDALGRHPKVFPPIFVSMVHAGEQSGTLSDSLKVIASQMESSYQLEKKVRGALMYPGVIVTAMIAIAILMFVFVIPTLLKTFEELNVELPFATKVILALSNLIQNYGLLVALAVIGLAALIAWYVKTPTGKSLLHLSFLKIPIIGSLVQEVNTARTARTLASLLDSGVDIVEAVAITASVVQNVHFKAVLDKASESIKKGELMSKIFAENDKLYPIFFAEMASVGEETGKTAEMFMGVATFYEDDVSEKTKDMSTIIEPFLILMIGGAVGFFAVSMIQPMYSLVDAI